MRFFLNALLYISLTCLAFFCLYYIRFIPAIDVKIDFESDPAFNYRMTDYIVKQGDIPKVDRLSAYPIGKDIKAILPTMMYRLCVLFYRFINRFMFVRLDRAIFIFSALCGAMIFIPIYFLSFELYNNKAISYVVAFFSGIIPAYLHRTFCYWYRYEVLGAPLLFMSLLFFIKAFNQKEYGRQVLNSVLSAIFMIFALAVWRMPVLFILFYMAALLYILIREKNISKEWLIITAITIGLPCVFILISKGHIFKKDFPFTYKLYPVTICQIIAKRIWTDYKMGDIAKLLYYNQELVGVSISDLTKAIYLSYSAFFIPIYIILYFKNRQRERAHHIIFIFLLLSFGSTILFARNKIMLAPLVAIGLGEYLAESMKYNKTFRNTLLAVSALFLLKTSMDSCTLAKTRSPYFTKIRLELKEIINNINWKTPKDAVILCDWSDGYTIQTYCNRPTITDAFLEYNVIVDRIFTISRIYTSSDEKLLWDFCKKNGVTHIIVTRNIKKAHTLFAGLDYDLYYDKDGLPTEAGKKTVLYRLTYEPNSFKELSLIHINNEFCLYRLRTV